MNEMDVLGRIKEAYQKILAEKLVGIYVHGSIAFGCFRWEKSDIDFLVVVNQLLSQEEKETLITVLLELEDQCPPKGLEMSVVMENACCDFHYPVPFELHFSNAHLESCRSDLEAYCQTMHGTDKDLAAHFTVVRKVGITLFGKERERVFGNVPKEDYVDSIKGDIKDAVIDIMQDPVYTILNLCRVLACLRDGLVLSKEQGGEWGMAHLPQSYHPIVGNAVSSYRGGTFPGDQESAKRFAKYMLGQIFGE